VKLLLDTHVLIWSQETPGRLGPAARKALLDPANEILVSAASSLEIARLVHLKQLVLKVGLGTWLAIALRSLQASSVPVDHAVALEAYTLPGPFHKDPADRLLVATARIEKATLLTADDLILKYPHVQTLDARK
jgi:PIN domain nuclease of toxin-antitoxin system